MGKGQLAGVPNWLKKQIDNLTTKVTKNETDITELNTNMSNSIGFIDTTNQLATIDVDTGSHLYTATEDCYVWGTMMCTSTLTPWVTLNGVKVCGGFNIANSPMAFSLYMKKGDELGCRASAGGNSMQYNATVLGLRK